MGCCSTQTGAEPSKSLRWCAQRRARLHAKRASAAVAHLAVDGALYCADRTVVIPWEDGSSTEMVLNPYTALHTIGSHSSLDGTVEAAEAERVLATIAWEVSDLSSQADAPEDLDGFIASAEALVNAGLVRVDARGIGYLVPMAFTDL